MNRAPQPRPDRHAVTAGRIFRASSAAQTWLAATVASCAAAYGRPPHAGGHSRGSSGRGNGMRSINQRQRRTWHADPLSQRQRAEQGGRRIGGELLHQRGRTAVALTQHRRDSRSRMASRLPGRPADGREQPQGAPTCSGDEFAIRSVVGPSRRFASARGGRWAAT